MIQPYRERAMYRWRSMTPAERHELLEHRKNNRLPYHRPPHYQSDTSLYLLTAACFEHCPIIGKSLQRIEQFQQQLLGTCCDLESKVFAWNVLPNHYHTLVESTRIEALLAAFGKLHGRTSFDWNGEECQRGRQVWCGVAETAMKSERHFWATLLYVLNNAVRHGYVERWQDWPFCNAAQWLRDVGRERAERLWREYPIDRYGSAWDPPEL